MLYLGQEGTYQEASEIAECLLGLRISPVQIYRLTRHYGKAIGAGLNKLVVDTETIAVDPTSTNGVVYSMVDGAMILTDEGYKENKLGGYLAINR